jgi:hypothetical protein
MAAIVQLDYQLDIDLDTIIDQYNVLYALANSTNINLRKPGGMDDNRALSYGSGTLYDMQTLKQDKFQQEFNAWCDYLSYYPQLDKLASDVQSYINQNGLKLGRVRLLTLHGKSNLTYHIDSESSIRYHVPLITNHNVFFVVDDIVERMATPGKLYSLDVQKRHTVVNASRYDRVHLVFDCYR